MFRANELYLPKTHMMCNTYVLCWFQFVPRDITVTTVWNRANVKTTFSCVIQPTVASVDTDTQVCKVPIEK